MEMEIVMLNGKIKFEKITNTWAKYWIWNEWISSK